MDNFLSTAELFPTSMRAWALSSSKLVDALASILAPILIGVIVTTQLGVSGVFFILFALSLLALIAEMRLGTETKLETLEALQLTDKPSVATE